MMRYCVISLLLNNILKLNYCNEGPGPVLWAFLLHISSQTREVVNQLGGKLLADNTYMK